MLYQAVFDGDAFRQGVTQAVNHTTFQLRLDVVGLDGQADVSRDPDVVDNDFFQFLIIGNLGYRRGNGIHIVGVGNA